MVYVPGNHDAFARAFYGEHLGGIVVTEETVHEAADGKRYLITHGDLYDGVVTRAKWLAVLGDWAYRGLLRANTAWNRARRTFGLGYWSFAAWLKGKVKEATTFIDDFERTLAEEARSPRARRGDLRPHPQGADPRHRRRRSTSTTATGWRAAPPSSSTPTDGWSCSTGPNAARWSMLDRRPRRRPPPPKPRRPVRPPQELEPATA